MMTALVITDDSPRADIERAIVALRTKQDRMPAHWTERRAQIGEEIDRLVEQWMRATD